MAKLEQIIQRVLNKDNFVTLQNYCDFALYYLDYIENNQQATIVSQNENTYRFFQYKREGNFNITRPFNSTLLYDLDTLNNKLNEFMTVLNDIKQNRDGVVVEDRSVINRTIYTIQQSIGFALDGGNLPNTARKLAGDLFERLILLILQYIGTNCENGVVQVPVIHEGEELFSMNYQHDLIIKNGNDIKMIGSVKTTSKDRIDKIFMDKFLYSKLTETEVPHIAVFLHDVQRKKYREPNRFGINTTFLTGHFKGYTIKLNPLDGVYYFDLRPNMLTDDILKEQITTFDKLICEDIWQFID